MPTRLVFARHGESQHTIDGVQGTMRTGKGLTTIMQTHPGKTVILIGHSESIMASFIALGGLPLITPFEAKSEPTGITIWQIDGDAMAFPGPRWHLYGFNIVPEIPD